MRKLKKGITVTALLLTMQCLANIAYAQGPGFPPAPTDTPIDGGATLVAIAAAGYSI